jgi:hypothetical protein
MPGSLLDVNVLIALVDSAHVHHALARNWFERRAVEGWATCPITENGFVRVVSGHKYPNVSLSPSQAAAVLERLKENHRAPHRWWPDDVSLTDTSLFQLDVLAGPRHVTDVYLLGIAWRNGGRLVSLDTHLPWSAIRDAGPDLAEIIAAD